MVVTAAVAVFAVPAAAQAATVTVTGDDGNPLAINPAAPPTIRNMSVQVGVAPAANERRYYRFRVVGPDQVPVSIATSCLDRTITPSRQTPVDYRGNGTYTIVLEQSTSNTCAAPLVTNVPYMVSAGVAIGQPQSWLLSRQPNDFTTIQHQFPFTGTPGTSVYEVRYARGGEIAADGSISGTSRAGFVDTTTGTVPLRFDAPGDWVIVARAQRGAFFTPWSPAVRVRVKGPFDLQTVTFPDSRGPSYRLTGTVRERAAAGKRVRIALARGRKGGKFRNIGRAKIRGNGTFSLKFNVRRVGRYRLRYTFRGSALVARGTIVQGIRIRRRLL